MSDETKQALSEAISAHVADECDGDMAASWVVVAEAVTIDTTQDRSYWHVTHDGSVINARGLLEFGLDYTRWTPTDGEDD